MPQIIDVRGFDLGVNYGVNKVRFPSPVPVGSKIRGGAELLEAEPVPGGVQTVIKITIEVEGAEKPACIIESVSRFLNQ
jgi:acyl dehydratase